MKRTIQQISYLFLFLLLLVWQEAGAQNYPVQVVPQLLPPYSLTLSDYYTGTREKLVVLLTNRDLQKPVLQVRLRMNIEGQGLSLRSREDVYYPPVSLEAGIPLRLSLSDLAPYFQVDNLEMQGFTSSQYRQGGKLPEGLYKFGFEAIEVSTGRVVSQKAMAMAWLSLSDPPLLNLPQKGSMIGLREPQNIIFQWTPRHLSSPNSAFNSEYEFSLTEIWDNGISPEAAFSSAPPLYQTTTTTTTLLYGPGEPPLMPGKRYGWQVKAKARSGADDYDLFRNQGYSEIGWFTLGSDCKAPQNLRVSISGRIPTLTWDADIKKNDYVEEYRQQGNARAAWFSQKTTETSMPLYDLRTGNS